MAKWTFVYLGVHSKAKNMYSKEGVYRHSMAAKKAICLCHLRSKYLGMSFSSESTMAPPKPLSPDHLPRASVKLFSNMRTMSKAERRALTRVRRLDPSLPHHVNIQLRNKMVWTHFHPHRHHQTPFPILPERDGYLVRCPN